MNGSKNLVVAILLLGVSYGVYQVITAPKEDVVPRSELTIAISEGPSPGSPSESEVGEPKEVAAKAPPLPSSNSFVKSIPTAQPPQKDEITLDVSSDRQAFSPPQPLNQATESWPNSQSFETVTARPADTASSGRQFMTSTPAPLTSEMRPITPPMGEAPPDAAESVTSPFSFPANSNASSPLAQSAAMPAQPTEPLLNVFPRAEQLCREGYFRDALEILTPYYRMADLPSDERQLLMEWLDGLAAKVIFSDEHHFVSSPYVVQPGDSLDTLSAQWRVPTNLIFNVNQDKIQNPLVLTPGTELKQIAGPFQAEIDRSTRTITLFVDDMYACRFDILNLDSSLEPGTFLVSKKSRRDAILGEFVVWLDSGIALFADQGQRPVPQAITLRQQDAKDINEILSPGSTVTIR